MNVLNVLDGVIASGAARTSLQHGFTREDVIAAREAISDLLVIAEDVNEWLIRTKREGCAHQRHLAQVLAVVKGEAV